MLTGLWSGRPFSYEGRHYRLQETLFWPPPVQRPRIPIWVAGHWPKSRAPFRRAARWDGVCPEGQLTLAEHTAMMAYIRRHRTSRVPFEVVRSAALPQGDAGKARSVIEAWAAAGVTWWITGTTGRPGAFEELRRMLAQGPPRI